MQTSSKKVIKARLSEEKLLAKKRFEEERMHDVLLLLQNLFEREEITVKFVLNALYDVGAINLIDNKLRYQFLNRPLKSVARTSKPVVRAIAIYWFQKNCPQLIVNWLYSKVSFPVKVEEAEPVAVEVVDVERERIAEIEASRYEVKRLRSQVRLLTGSLVLMTAILGGTSIWLGYHLNLQAKMENPFRLTIVETQD